MFLLMAVEACLSHWLCLGRSRSYEEVQDFWVRMDF